MHDGWSHSCSARHRNRFVVLIGFIQNRRPASGCCRFHKIKKARSAYAVLSFNWSPSFNSRSFKGDDRHEDPMFYFTLTSSRIDSIRASQYLTCFMILSASSLSNLNGNHNGLRLRVKKRTAMLFIHKPESAH